MEEDKLFLIALLITALFCRGVTVGEGLRQQPQVPPFGRGRSGGPKYPLLQLEAGYAADAALCTGAAHGKKLLFLYFCSFAMCLGETQTRKVACVCVYVFFFSLVQHTQTVIYTLLLK